MNDELYRKRILLAVLMVVAAAAAGYMLFLRGSLFGGEQATQVDLPVPERSITADEQTTKAVGRAAADPAALQRAARQAAGRAGVQLLSEEEEEGGNLTVRLRAKPAQLFSFLADLDSAVSFAAGGQIRARGPGALIASLQAEGKGQELDVTLSLRSP